MDTRRRRWEDGATILYDRAVRIPLPNVDAERTLRDHITSFADASVRRSELLADPDLPLTEAYGVELDEMHRGFEHRLRQLTGEDYREVADAYLRGERDDWVGALAVYYLECYYRLQERLTLDEEIFLLAVLRYPDWFTVNLSFAVGEVGGDAVHYESPRHADTDLTTDHHERYFAECQYSQRQAAEYISDRIHHVRDAVPDPDSTPFDERKYGGFIYVTGRQGSVFSEYLGPLDPDPDRFDDDATVPGLVPEGPELERAKRELLDGSEFVA